MASKEFYHNVPNSVIHCQIGPAEVKTLQFPGGYLSVDEDDTETLAALEAIADKPGSPVTHVKRNIDPEAAAAAELVKMNAAKVVQALAEAKPGQV